MPPRPDDGENLYVVQTTYRDVEHFESDLRKASDVRLIQLEASSFRGDLSLIKFPLGEILFAEMGRPVRVLGVKEQDYAIFCFTLRSKEAPVLSHTAEVSEKTMFGFDPNRSVRLLLPRKSLVVTVKVKRSHFNDCLEAMERDDIDDRFFAQNLVHCPEAMPIVHDYLRSLQWYLQNPNTSLTLPYLEDLLLGDLLPLIIGAIPPTSSNSRKPGQAIRKDTFNQVEDYIIHHMEKPLTLQDLCRKFHFDKRTLFYSFQEYVGMGPMAYLKHLRLHAIRRILKQSAPQKGLVAKLAGRYGFYNTGHFAKDYQSLFGELPSETLSGHPGTINNVLPPE
jgi:AraC family ethanolamine operon transcriptional activator